MTCRPPTGWVPIVIQPYDTLASLSLVYRTSVDVLRTKNCLLSDQLVAGSILYVPPLPTSTFIPCGAPANWGYYTVVPGDTLYHISMLYRVTVSQLMQANCLYTSNISAGQVLRVPNVPTSTPGVRDTPIPTWTAPSTLTPSQPAPTTGVPTATQTPSATTVIPATDTATSPATETNIPTDTAAPTDTSVPTNAPLPTDTPTPPTPAASA
jgi:LysM repeat protein